MHLTLLSLLSPLILLSCYLLHKVIWVPFRFKKHFDEQGVRGPDYRPVFGNSAEMRQRLSAEAESRPIYGGGISHDIAHRVVPYYSHWSTVYGKNFLFWFGTKPRLAIADPDMIKELLVNTNGSFNKFKFDPSTKILFGNGLVTLEGEKWDVHRRITNQAFNMERIKVIIVIPSFLFFILNMNRMLICHFLFFNVWKPLIYRVFIKILIILTVDFLGIIVVREVFFLILADKFF